MSSESPYDSGESPNDSYSGYKYQPSRYSPPAPSYGESPDSDGESPVETSRKSYAPRKITTLEPPKPVEEVKTRTYDIPKNDHVKVPARHIKSENKPINSEPEVKPIDVPRKKGRYKL